jgi:hypothetical protein
MEPEILTEETQVPPPTPQPFQKKRPISEKRRIAALNNLEKARKAKRRRHFAPYEEFLGVKNEVDVLRNDYESLYEQIRSQPVRAPRVQDDAQPEDGGLGDYFGAKFLSSVTFGGVMLIGWGLSYLYNKAYSNRPDKENSLFG